MYTLLTILGVAAVIPASFRLADLLGKNKGFTTFLTKMHLL
jgi:hypothetical protein